MDAIHIGPLALPLTALAPLSALGAANLAAWGWMRRRRLDPGPTLLRMVIWGLLAARVAFVLKHHDIYFEAPLQILDLRDGGYVAFAGLLAALAAGAEELRHNAPLRLPLMSSALAGLLVWAGATLAIAAVQDTRAPLPPVALQRLDGNTVALPALARGPSVVNLWATWCPPCRREMPALARAQADNPGVSFVFVNAGEDAATVRRYLDAERLQLANVVIDRPGALARAMGASGYPTTLFFDAGGKLVGRHMGELSAAQLRERLAQLE